ncbi:MAG: DUF2752 domain-containing protein [Bacteroidales bacterium]
MLTGYQCPGCGSQRALHQLLHLNIDEALKLNALFVVGLPYVLFGIIANFIGIRNNRMKNIIKELYSTKALTACLIIALIFGVLRNLI